MEEDKELGPAVTVYHLRHAAGDGEGRSSSWCRRVAYSPTTTDGNGRHVHHRVSQRIENHQQENSIHSPAAVSQGLWICPRYVCMSRMFNRDLIHPHSQPFHGLGLASLLLCVCVCEREREREREREHHAWWWRFTVAFSLFSADMVRCTQVRLGEHGVWKCRGDLPKHLRFQDTRICCEVGEILRSEINSFPFFLSFSYPIRSLEFGRSVLLT
jgi:hypothetical protein